MRRIQGALAFLPTCWSVGVILIWIAVAGQLMARAQAVNRAEDNSGAAGAQAAALSERVQTLEAEVAQLKAIVGELQARNDATTQAAASEAHAPTSPDRPATPIAATSTMKPQASASTTVAPAERKTLDFLRDTTVNVGLDAYYDYNFNHPVGRVNLLRPYDVLGNEFSLNQASVIFDHPPDLSAGRRWGGRLDLQFGQATDTLQGNPSNEPRPDIYRNIFQVYGTYVIPLGKGVNVDFGKWGSSLGIEGNYTKDQMNYSRALWFDFLPFYHMGLRASIPVTEQFNVNYWVVNGTNQTEATKGFKDQLFGFTARPRKTISWTMNYYLGQEHPDRSAVPPSLPIPVQPGLSFQGIHPAPDGRTHIFDSYVAWQVTPKLTAAVEGDYVIQRLWANAAPGRSSAPAHVDGGAGYLRYQFTPKLALATRAEYLSDRGGLFSGVTQALKENTITFDYQLANGFLMRYEWRRDYSNQPSFLSDAQGALSKEQSTATVGLIWWWGPKEGAW